MKQLLNEWKNYLQEKEEKTSVEWVKPNLKQIEFEWEEEVEFQKNEKQVPEDVRKFLKKNFPNKESWTKGVENAKVVTIPVKFSKTIRNTPDDKEALLGALSPDSPDPQGTAKAKRVNNLFSKGKIPMPIIINASGGLWLIGGKTRLGTARYIHKIPAKVLLLSDEKKELNEGLGDILKTIFGGEPSINEVTKVFLFKNHRARKIFQALKETPSVGEEVQRYVDKDNYKDALIIALRADEKDMKAAGVSDDDWKYLRDSATKIQVAVKQKKLGADYWG